MWGKRMERKWDLAEGVVFRHQTMQWERSWRALIFWLALWRHWIWL